MAESEMSDGMIDPTDLLEATRASTTALRYKMDQLMEAQRRCQRLYAKSGRKVVANRVWKLRTGNTKVFEKQTDGLEVDTAVMLLLDRSQSMQSQLGLACQATLSLLLSLARVDGVSAAAAAFPAPVGLSDRFNQHGKGVTVLTDFGERVVATASRYASLGDYGMTPMAEALLWSVYKLLSQKADRRILFVTTDGEPDHKEAALKVIKMAERCGIEIIGLGIAQEIAHLIPESRKIDHIDQMPKAVFEMLESKLALPLAA
jgi:cobalamin biosynthesis protein CobT